MTYWTTCQNNLAFWLIDWLIDPNFSNISAISWRELIFIIKLRHLQDPFKEALVTILNKNNYVLAIGKYNVALQWWNKGKHFTLNSLSYHFSPFENEEIGEKENQSPDQTDNQEVVQRFRIYSDPETDAFLKENKTRTRVTKPKVIWK